MEYRNLGGAGSRVSEIALGNWITHGGQVGDDAAKACVHAALDGGINFFDTADVYEGGKAESVLGNILKGQERSSYVLATKVFFRTGKGPNDRGLSRKHIMEAIHKSLNRLQTDYVDLYQAHRFDKWVPLEETLRAWDDLVRQGKVNYIGVSEWSAGQIARALEIASDLVLERIVTNQPQYSMLWRVPEAEVMPLCRKENVGQICWSPLAMGVLTGKYKPGEEREKGSRAAAGGVIEPTFLADEVLASVQNLRPIADELGLSMATLAVAWVLQNDNVSAAIVGASRPEQVQENVKASGVRLDESVMQRIDDVLDDHVIYNDPYKRSEGDD
ncbi:MAG TPA: aldo/keto reductase family protein [Actinomycetota bacterium]|nr:aldo/keto reductase family protein [Actinomycetota bacterium]